MGRYYDARGHISCDFEQIEGIKQVVDTHASDQAQWRREQERLDLYRSGWLYQPRPINWIGHVFYGASVRIDGVDLLKGCLREIAARFPDVTGMFLVDDDEGLLHETIELANGQVSVTTA